MADAANPVEGVETGSTQVHLDTAALEAAKIAEEKAGTTETAQSLGVSPAQFDKFWSEEKAEYNWRDHAKEQSWVMEHGGKPPAEDPKAVAKADGPVVPGAELDDAGVQKVVEAAGLDFNELDMQIAKHGELTAVQMKALTDLSIPEDTIKGYVNYLSTTAQAHIQAVEDHFGGEQGFAQLREWGKANLTVDEMSQYETQLADPESWRPAADQLLSRAGMPAGKRADPIVPDNAPKTPATPGDIRAYENQAEMIADMRKPEYKSSPAFRNQVMARARISTWEMNPRLHTLSG